MTTVWGRTSLTLTSRVALCPCQPLPFTLGKGQSWFRKLSSSCISLSGSPILMDTASDGGQVTVCIFGMSLGFPTFTGKATPMSFLPQHLVKMPASWAQPYLEWVQVFSSEHKVGPRTIRHTSAQSCSLGMSLLGCVSMMTLEKLECF